MKHTFVYSALFLLTLLMGACSSSNQEQENALPADFASMNDTAKLGVLVRQGLSPDSIALYVLHTAEGRNPGVKFTDYANMDVYLYGALGDEGFNSYRIAYDDYVATMPLVPKLKQLQASPDHDPQSVGFELGLEYINQVLDQKMTIGKVDREVAELHRALGQDEDTYSRFLQGFAAAIASRPAGQVPADITKQYGKTNNK